VSLSLTKLQKQLCNLLQSGLPTCSRPFAEIAKSLNTNEQEILHQTDELKKAGVIRRLGVVINYRALGLISTLVAAHVPEDDLHEIAKAVNSLENVSHNYLRKHRYNLWFTLQAESAEQIKVILSKLSARFGIDFHSLPVEHVFKLDVRFDAESEGELLLQDVEKAEKCETVQLNNEQKSILAKLQNDLEVIAKPFNFLCSKDLREKEVFRIITELIDKGVIRRIRAIVDHRKLGFAANVLFASKVSEDKIVEAGKRLACFGIVSHCYGRRPLKDWPYNLLGMMHGKNMGQIQHIINKFVEAEGIESFELLPTALELKKEPIKGFLE